MNDTPPRRYGLAAPEKAAALSGRQFLQAIIDGELPQAPISQTLNFWLTQVGQGSATFEGEPLAHLLNPMGSVHGGWALTLIDSATGCAAHSLLPSQVGYTTVETKGNFSRPIGPDAGRVRCCAQVVAQGKRIITAQASVLSQDGKVLAHGTSTMMVLGG